MDARIIVDHGAAGDREPLLRAGRFGWSFAVVIVLAGDAGAQFPLDVPLGGVVAPNGTRINGTVSNQQLGQACAPAGDLDGDGVSDVLLGSPLHPKPGGVNNAGAVHVIYGTPTFSSFSNYSVAQTGPGGYSVRGRTNDDNMGAAVAGIGDINGDGLADFLVGAPGAESGVTVDSEGEAYVIFGKPADATAIVDIANLTPAIGIRIRGHHSSSRFGASVASIGDFDGDGKNDIAIGAPQGGDPAPPLATPFVASDVAVGDVTGDGIADIVATHATQSVYSVGTGLGGGAFTSGLAVTAFVPDIEEVLLVDDDLDGDLDMVFAGRDGALIQGRVARLENFGFGGFGFPTTVYLGPAQVQSVDAADADLDGDLDYVVAARPNGSGPGQADVVFNTFVGPNSGTIALPLTTSALVTSARFADLQGDGLPEVITTEQSVSLVAVTNDVVGGFTGWQSFTATDTPTLIGVGDLDGDGDLDAAVKQPKCRELLNNGSGIMALAAASGDSLSFGASMGDFDGDGRLDTIDVSSSPHSLRVQLNNGDATYAPALVFSQDAAMLRARAFDFDENGVTDVLSLYSFVPRIGLCLNDGVGNLLGNNEGRVYVLRGSSPQLAMGDVNVAALTPADGFTVRGGHGGARAGSSVAGAGDIDGDGHADLVIGSVAANGGAASSGKTHVLFGGPTVGQFGSIVLPGLSNQQTWLLDGSNASAQVGECVAGGGDIDADGVPDVAVGAPGAPNGALVEAGLAVVVRGSAIARNGVTTTQSLTGATGVRIPGAAAGDGMGDSIGFGDLNDDGISDLFIGAWRASPAGSTSGRAYCLFGDAGFGASGTIAVQSLAANHGIRFTGQTSGDRAGFAVSSAGDLNADGRDDLLIGASQVDTPTFNAGAVYAYYGKPRALGGDVTTLSLGSGGSQNLELRAGGVHAFRRYVVLGSITGTTPGLQFGGVNLPLNLDPYTMTVATYLNTPFFANFSNNLDAAGNGTASLNLPPGITGVPPQFLLRHAFLVLNAAQVPIYASNDYPLYLVP